MNDTIFPFWSVPCTRTAQRQADSIGVFTPGGAKLTNPVYDAGRKIAAAGDAGVPGHTTNSSDLLALRAAGVDVVETTLSVAIHHLPEPAGYISPVPDPSRTLRTQSDWQSHR